MISSCTFSYVTRVPGSVLAVSMPIRTRLKFVCFARSDRSGRLATAGPMSVLCIISMLYVRADGVRGSVSEVCITSLFVISLCTLSYVTCASDAAVV